METRLKRACPDFGCKGKEKDYKFPLNSVGFIQAFKKLSVGVEG
jgi:hypothetical protein